VTSKRLGWFVLLIAAVLATAIGVLIPFFAPGDVLHGKGGPENALSSYLPSYLLLAGVFGMVLAAALTVAPTRSPRRLSALSALCGGSAALLEWPWPFLVTGYAGILLGGLLSVVAIGAAIGAISRPMRSRAIDISLAVLGLLAGVPSALFAVWVLLLTLGGGMGE
jgi:hypothetical protein